MVLSPYRNATQIFFAPIWLKWAQWLIEHRELLGRFSINVDQVSFALACEEIKEDVEFLPPQTNAILHILEEVSCVYAFHLSTGHIPLFQSRFNSDRTMNSVGFTPDVADSVELLNICIKEATKIIQQLPSLSPHIEKFLNPHWKR